MPSTESEFLSADPFGTAELRSAVLDTWQRSPARLREDANAEESLAVVGYAGRVVVELAANAADAAIEAQVPGRLRFSLVGGELRVANTGAPLTAAGVAALASLRASAKRSEPGGVGHFGVGFTAVLAVSDHPRVVSTTGAIGFSGPDTAAAIAAIGSPQLNHEVADRDGHVPVLRLPWPITDQPALPTGFSTEVRLPLRSGIDPAEVLAGIGDYLLLALPGLEMIELPGRTLSRGASDSATIDIFDGELATSWQLRTRTGEFDPVQLHGLPTEQRRRRQWRISWAYPTSRPLGPDVLYSPTPTDEALDLPARLIGSFPVDDTRRHLAAGPITDQLLNEAVGAYLELMADTAPEQRLRLLPLRDFGRSELDNRLRQGIWAGIRRTPLLVSASGEAVRPDQAAMLPGASPDLIALAAEAIPGLLPAPRDTLEREGLRALGVRALGYPELSSALGALNREPEFWNRVYGELDTFAVDDLADLPVPLATGRTVIGARGCLVIEDVAADWLAAIADAVPGLRVVHPAAAATPAARRLLLRIGAQTADPTAILADPALLGELAELREDLEADDVDIDRVQRLADAVLGLVTAGADPTDQVRADLLLTNDSGEPWPAAELLLPNAPLAGVLAADADLEELDAQWVQRYSAEVLGRAGVLSGFRIVHNADPQGPDHDLPDEEQYWQQVIRDGPPPAVLLAVADLDLVADDKWPAALELLRTERSGRDALLPAGALPSYTAWWLSRFALIEGQPPRWWRLPAATDLAGLYDPLPTPMDPGFAAAIGVRASLAQVLATDPEDALARFTDTARDVPAVRVPALTGALIAAMRGRGLKDLPDGVRTMAGSVVDAQDAVVLDRPWLSQLIEPRRVVPGCSDPAEVARFFDLELASAQFHGSIIAATTSATPETRRRALGVGRELGFGFADLDILDGLLDTTTVDPSMVLSPRNGPQTPVRWWVDGASSWVDGSAEGWGRLLAYRAGDWSLRHTATALFAGRSVEVVEEGLESCVPG